MPVAKDTPQPQQLTLAADISPSVDAAPWAIDVSRPGGPGVLIGFLDGESGLVQQVRGGGSGQFKVPGGGRLLCCCWWLHPLPAPIWASSAPHAPVLPVRSARGTSAITLKLC